MNNETAIQLYAYLQNNLQSYYTHTDTSIIIIDININIFNDDVIDATIGDH